MGGKGLLSAFLKEYRAAQGQNWDPDFTDRQRIVIHFGTHIGYWPTRVKWGNHEETLHVVQIGSETLKHGLEKDYAWFAEGPLGPLFS